MPPDTVSREAYELALQQAETYRTLLYTVTPALVGGLVFMFLRLQNFGEKCAVALVQVTDAVEGFTEELRRGRKE